MAPGVPESMTEERLTLHDAIAQVLQESPNEWMEVKDISHRINREHLYERQDRSHHRGQKARCSKAPAEVPAPPSRVLQDVDSESASFLFVLFRSGFIITGLRLLPRGEEGAPDYPLVFDYGALRVELAPPTDADDGGYSRDTGVGTATLERTPPRKVAPMFDALARGE